MVMSYRPIHSTTAAAEYFAGYYAPDDAPNKGEPPGQWHGPGAAALGLTGPVKQQHLQAVLNGQHPQTGETIVKHITPEGRKPVTGRDFVFSAPKSVSTLWAVAPTELRAKIEAAHDRAVERAVERFAHEHIFVRRGHGGVEKLPGESVYGLFQHSTSRANDPDLHTHAVFGAMARGPDGRWTKIDFDPRAIHAAGAHYRALLAEELNRAGVPIVREAAEGRKGDGYFRVHGVPDSLNEHWSQRRAVIKEQLNESDAWSARSGDAVARTTRTSKEEVDREANWARWAVEAAEHGFGPEQAEALVSQEPLQLAILDEAPDDATLIAALTETRAAVRGTDVERAVFEAAVGRLTAAQAEARLERVLGKMTPVRRLNQHGHLETFYARPADIEAERRIPAHLAALRAGTHHAAERAAVEQAIAARPTIRAEQAEMVRAATGGSGLALIEGRAGTGKSYALAAVADAYRASGYTVRGVAVAGKAAADLREGTGMEASTVARLRIDLEAGRAALDRRTVLVIEEAGMLGSRDAAGLLDAARRSGAKVIMVGDTAQLPPVAAGTPFRDAVRLFGLDAELRAVVRQREAADRDIAEAFRAGRAAEARQLLREAGRWHTAPTTRVAIAEAAAAFARDRAAGREAVILATTRDDAWRANVEARQALRAAGALGQQEIRFGAHHGRELRLAVGDRVLFRRRAEIGGTRLVNGTTAAVVAVDRDGGRATLRIGQGDGARDVVLDATSDGHASARAALAYGHAITVYVAQGTTVHAEADGLGGNVFAVLRDAATLSRELAYVAASRNQGHFSAYLAERDDARIVERAAERTQPETLRAYRDTDGTEVAPLPPTETLRRGDRVVLSVGDPERDIACGALAKVRKATPGGEVVLGMGRRAVILRPAAAPAARNALTTIGHTLRARDRSQHHAEQTAERAGRRYAAALGLAALGQKVRAAVDAARETWRAARAGAVAAITRTWRVERQAERAAAIIRHAAADRRILAGLRPAPARTHAVAVAPATSPPNASAETAATARELVRRLEAAAAAWRESGDPDRVVAGFAAAGMAGRIAERLDEAAEARNGTTLGGERADQIEREALAEAAAAREALAEPLAEFEAVQQAAQPGRDLDAAERDHWGWAGPAEASAGHRAGREADHELGHA